MAKKVEEESRVKSIQMLNEEVLQQGERDPVCPMLLKMLSKNEDQ